MKNKHESYRPPSQKMKCFRIEYDTRKGKRVKIVEAESSIKASLDLILKHKINISTPYLKIEEIK